MSTSPTSSQPTTRRTRIVCIADTHNNTPKLPRGDVLIHAGDLTNTGSYTELKKQVAWLEKADFEVKLIVAGNHDTTLSPDYPVLHGPTLHPSNPQDSAACLRLLATSPTLTYLNHASTRITLTSPTGPRTTFTVFGSPHSPLPPSLPARRFSAFQYVPTDAETLWRAVPLQTDILITHAPPAGHGDATGSPLSVLIASDAAGDGLRRSLGCPALHQALAKVRPRLHVCGHVHAGRGAERVRWRVPPALPAAAMSGLDVFVPAMEEPARPGDFVAGSVGRFGWSSAAAVEEEWTDPASLPDQGGRICLVDLTGRKAGVRRLDNDGGGLELAGRVRGVGEVVFEDDGVQPDRRRRRSVMLEGLRRRVSDPIRRHRSRDRDRSRDRGLARAHSVKSVSTTATVASMTSFVIHHPTRLPPPLHLHPSRLGRRETCVVNAAICPVRGGWAGPVLLNKPVVVDLDLPVA